MANTLNNIEVYSDYKHLQIREITDSGGYHRRVIICGDDVSGEVQEIQDKAEAEWTDEVKDAYAGHEEKQKARRAKELAEQEAKVKLDNPKPE